MLKKPISATLIALVVAIGIPASAFADDMDSAKVVGGVVESVTSVVNSGVISENTGNPIEQPDSVTQDQGAVNNESGSLPDGKEPVAEEPTIEEPKVEEPISNEPAVEPVPEVIPPTEEPVATEPAIVVTEPAVNPPVEEPVVTEPAIVVTEPAIVVTEPAITVTEPAIVVPEASTLVIHHLFESGDIVCEDYETVEGLTAGETVRLGDYNYEDEYTFTECLNEDETAKLVAGENRVTLKYTLKEGYVITKKAERR